MKSLDNIICVATTDAAASEAAFQGISQSTYTQIDQVFKRVFDVILKSKG